MTEVLLFLAFFIFGGVCTIAAFFAWIIFTEPNDNDVLTDGLDHD